MKYSFVFVGLSVVVLSSLVGCGVSNQPSANLTGVVLGWDNNLYKLTSQTDANHVGKRLGLASYHGATPGVFTIFELSGSSPSKDVVFESDGHYYQAVATKPK